MRASMLRLPELKPQTLFLGFNGCRAAKRSAATDLQHEEQARPTKRARRSVAQGPIQLATDARGAAEEARLEGIRRQQEEQARRDAEFKVGRGLVGQSETASRRALVV